MGALLSSEPRGGQSPEYPWPAPALALFDVPVTVTILYTDGRTQDEVVAVTDQLVEWTMATERPVKQVQVNRDYAAVAIFERF